MVPLASIEQDMISEVVPGVPPSVVGALLLELQAKNMEIIRSVIVLFINFTDLPT